MLERERGKNYELIEKQTILNRLQRKASNQEKHLNEMEEHSIQIEDLLEQAKMDVEKERSRRKSTEAEIEILKKELRQARINDNRRSVRRTKQALKRLESPDSPAATQSDRNLFRPVGHLEKTRTSITSGKAVAANTAFASRFSSNQNDTTPSPTRLCTARGIDTNVVLSKVSLLFICRSLFHTIMCRNRHKPQRLLQIYRNAV